MNNTIIVSTAPSTLNNEATPKKKVGKRQLIMVHKKMRDYDPVNSVIDMSRVKSVTRSYLSGDVLIYMENGERIVVVDAMKDVLRKWERYTEIVVFHKSVHNGDGVVPYAFDATSIRSLDTSFKDGATLVRTEWGDVAVTESLEEAMQVWAA